MVSPIIMLAPSLVIVAHWATYLRFGPYVKGLPKGNHAFRFCFGVYVKRHLGTRFLISFLIVTSHKTGKIA